MLSWHFVFFKYFLINSNKNFKNEKLYIQMNKINWKLFYIWKYVKKYRKQFFHFKNHVEEIKFEIYI